jgi:nucleoside transporter
MKLRLSVMMFLQYAIWGAWLPILLPYLQGHLHFSGGQISWIFAAGAAGAIVGPFVAGQFADRFFATEKFLGVSHLIGAVLVWMLSTTHDFHPFLRLSMVYGLVYAPTLALTNSICFHHLEDRDRDFGRVRLWGTIGWIVAGILVGQWLNAQWSPDGLSAVDLKAKWDEGRADAFKLSAVLGVVLGLYCFTLPHTPPAKNAAQKSAVGRALAYLVKQPLLTLFLLAVPMSCVHQFYFVHTSDFLSRFQVGAADDFAKSVNKLLGVGGGGLMTIGQMSEIVVLALVSVLAKTTSRKVLLATGLAAYALRMFLFAYTDSVATVLLGVALHGFCFGCFIFVAFMVVDEETPADVRASAQNLFNLVIVGVGIIVGSWFAVDVTGNWARTRAGVAATAEIAKQTDAVQRAYYTHLFAVPMWIAIGCLLVLLIAYPSRKGPALAAGTAES